MARVSVSINGQGYEIACGDGQEEHVLSLAQYVDDKVSQLVAAVGQVGEARLLAMVSLLLADEVAEARDEANSVKSQQDSLPFDAPAQPTVDLQNVADLLSAMAGRIESIAERVEAS